MVSKNQSDQLPHGWKVQIKVKTGRKFKVYVHSKTGKKLYSRLDVLRYTKNGRIANNSSKATKERSKKSSKEQKMQVVVADDCIKDLPTGWTLEVKTRQSGPREGATYMCFTDPSSGSKFYSMPEVFRYLQIRQNSAGPSGREERRSTRHSPINRPVEQRKAQESNVEANEVQNSKATTSRRLSSGKVRAAVRPFEQQKAQDSKVEANELQNSQATSKRLTRGEKKRPVEQLKAQESNVKAKLLQDSKSTASTRVTRLSSGKNERPVKQQKAQESNVEAKLLQDSKSTASIRVTRLSSGKTERPVEQLMANESNIDAKLLQDAKSTASTRVTRLSSGENERPVEQLKPRESNVEAKSSQDSKATASARVTRLSSWKNERPVEQLKPQESNVEAKLSQDSKFTASARVTRLSSGKNERPVEQLKAQEYNVKANLLQNSKSTASSRLSLATEMKPVEQLKAQDSNEEAIELQDSKSNTKRLSSGKTKVVIEYYVDEDLPSGWIKEMRKKVYGTKVRTDPFYYHPASGLVFRSKREVLHYLETGEISRHAYRRRNNVDKEDPAIEKISLTPSVKRDPTITGKTRNTLFTGEETLKGSPLTPEARVAKEAAVRRITRSSSRVRPTSITEAIPDPNSFNKTANINQEILSSPVIVSPETHENDGNLNHYYSTMAIELPSTSTRNKLAVDNTLAVSLKGCSSEKVQTAKSKTNDQQTLTMPSCSTKRFAGVDTQPVSQLIPIDHALQATRMKSVGTKPVPSLVNIPNLQDKPNPPNGDTQNGSSCQPAKYGILNVSSITMLSTEEHLNNSGSSMRNTHLVFSENEVIDVPPINTDVTELSLENPKDDPIQEGQKIENSIPGWPVSEGKPGSIGTDTETPGTEFRFPPLLWSDPCLEFAYKTLTGAIPLDDNLAIEDYIQHQLHTSKQRDDFQNLPDIDMPSFVPNDATTQAPPLPDNIKLPNGNDLTPQKTTR